MKRRVRKGELPSNGCVRAGFYLRPEQPAADPVPQTGPGAGGFPLRQKIHTLLLLLLLIRTAPAHSFRHQSDSTLKSSFGRRCSDVQTSSRRSFFPEQLVTEGIVSESPGHLRGESGQKSRRRLPASALFESKSLDLGVREGTKPVGLPSTPAWLLFYVPDGFGGLAPENPLLPSLPTCSRVSQRGAPVGKSTG